MEILESWIMSVAIFINIVTCVVKLALHCHDLPVDEEGNDVAPSEDGRQVVEDIFVTIPVFNIHKSFIPEEKGSATDDIDH